MQSTIGYLLHGWKNLSYSPAVILNDEVISDNPEGGTGKGLFMNGLAQMKKLVEHILESHDKQSVKEAIKKACWCF